MEGDRRQFYLNIFVVVVTALKRVLEEHRNVGKNLNFICRIYNLIRAVFFQNLNVYLRKKMYNSIIQIIAYMKL